LRKGHHGWGEIRTCRPLITVRYFLLTSGPSTRSTEEMKVLSDACARLFSTTGRANE
jgi:hypothetical protein